MILVIGGTGNVGSEVAKQLTAAGEKVRSLSRDPSKAKTDPAGGFEYVKGDLADPASLAAGLRGAEKVFLVSAGDPNIMTLHGNLYAEAKKAGVRHVVRLSALGAGKEGPVSLLNWHTQADRALADSDLPYTILRPHFFMQNFHWFAPTIREQGAFYMPMRDGKVSLVDVRDIAAVAVAALTEPGHQGKAYDVTGPESLSMAELAGKLSAAAGKAVRYVDVPPAAARAAMIGMGLPEWMADGLVELYAEFAAGKYAAVSSVVRQATGTPGRTFDTFAAEFGHALA
jgi:uncharacterized protein YbjT (DUF2867 family)